jgi:uridine kinase
LLDWQGRLGAGKSTIARHVASRLKGSVISMEHYFVVMNELPLEQRAKKNYDTPFAMDVILESHVRRYAAGEAIDTPIVDFSAHLRVTDRHERISVASLLIVEGILALHFRQFRSSFDLLIYLDAPDSVCRHRRTGRDITERQRSLEFIQFQYENNVFTSCATALITKQTLRQSRTRQRRRAGDRGKESLRRHRRKARSPKSAISSLQEKPAHLSRRGTKRLRCFRHAFHVR